MFTTAIHFHVKQSKMRTSNTPLGQQQQLNRSARTSGGEESFSKRPSERERISNEVWKQKERLCYLVGSILSPRHLKTVLPVEVKGSDVRALVKPLSKETPTL